jgi:hypothetical protein
VSVTSVTAQYRLSRGYDPAALRDAYVTALAKRDWRAAGPPPGPESAPDSVYLYYCRPVDNVTSRLVIHTQPGGLYLTIEADTDRASCTA